MPYIKENWIGVPKGFRRCIRCREVKSLNRKNFGRKNGGRHWTSWCRGCAREHARKSAERQRREHPEKVRESKRLYAQSEGGKRWKRARSAIDNHARRQRHRGRPIRWTPADWRRAKRFFDNLCAYCDCGGKLTQDHFIPISHPQFPGTIRGNIVPACQPCNSSKCDADPFIWVRSADRIARIVSFLSAERARAKGGVAAASVSQPALF
jgi:5-methylcytosine-specific restriction endonuclease McrA